MTQPCEDRWLTPMKRCVQTWSRSMPGYDRNSEWERRMQALRTNQGLLSQALSNPTTLKKMMTNYYEPVMGYLTYFLLRYKLVPDESAAIEAAEWIWKELKLTLPEKLAQEWSRGKKSFRD